MINTEENNNLYPTLAAHTVIWHKDRNLIEGATDMTQTNKMLEEFTELYAACMPGMSEIDVMQAMIHEIESLYARGKLKAVHPNEAAVAKIDALGDIDVIRLNILERNKWTAEQALQVAYNEIKDRKGMIVNGSFVKATDLHLYKDEIEQLGYNYLSVLEENGVLDAHPTGKPDQV